MKPLPRYLLAYNDDELPTGIVISTQPPYLWAMVWMDKDPLAFAQWCAQYKGLGHYPIPGYNIALFVGGTITENRMRTSTIDIQSVIDKELAEMSNFYVKAKIEKNNHRFNRYRTVNS